MERRVYGAGPRACTGLLLPYAQRPVYLPDRQDGFIDRSTLTCSARTDRPLTIVVARGLDLPGRPALLLGRPDALQWFESTMRCR
jgi:hypothetical protein